MIMAAKVRRLLLLTVVNSIAMSDATPSRLRQALLRRAGIRLGAGASFASHCLLRGTDLALGDGSRVGSRVFFDSGPTTIGREVSIGTDTRFLTGTHELADARRRAGRLRHRPIIVEDGAWIGAGVTIMGGVTIGAGSVVAAGAVVVEDTKPNALYAGVPAVWKRDFAE